MQSICRKSMSFVRQLALRRSQMVSSRLSSTDRTDSSGHDMDIYDPISNEPQIPSSAPIRPNESTDVLRKRLLYQSRKRGILENDLILSNFADKYLNTFGEKQLEMYDYIINMPSNDWELYYWSVGRKPVPKEYSNEVMDLLVEHTRNRDKQSRIRQPDI